MDRERDGGIETDNETERGKYMREREGEVRKGEIEKGIEIHG